MSLLSEKFESIEREYRADVEALRAAAGLCAEAEALADALEATDGVSASPVVTVCRGQVDIRICCWNTSLRVLRQAIENAGLLVAFFEENELCGKPAERIALVGMSTSLYVERPAVKVAA